MNQQTVQIEDLFTRTALSAKDGKDIIAKRWYEATERCQSDLRRVSTFDYQNTQHLNSYTSLLLELRRVTDLPVTQKWANDVEVDIRPALETLQATFKLFTDSMYPHVLEINFVWSVLFVVIKVSLRSQQKWSDFVEQLSKTRRGLEILYRHATWFKDKDGSYEFLNVICNSLIGLADYWIEVIIWCRQNPIGPVGRELWAKVDERYESTLNNIEQGNMYLSNLVALKRKSEAHSRQSELRSDLLNRFPMSGDTANFPLNTLPYPEYRGFYGRKDILKQLEVALIPEKSSRGIQSVLLHGLGGVGKSQTALAFAHRNSNCFDAIFWIRSETTTSLKDSFTNIALALNLAGARGEGHDEENLLYFQAWLRKQAADEFGRTWLLIFDNCGSIEEIFPKYIPVTKGSILITSRSPSACLRDSSLIHIKPLPEHEGVGLLKQLIQSQRSTIYNTKDNELLSRLVNKVGGLPLGLQVIAGLVNAWDLPVSEFCDHYDQNERDLMTNFGRVIDYDHDITRVIGKDHVLDNVWKMSFKELGSDAKALLGVMCLLSPNQIPIFLFNLDEADTISILLLSVCMNRFRLYNAIADLRKAALVSGSDMSVQPSGSTTTAMLDVHPLIQEAVIYSLKDNLSGYFTAVIFLLFNVFKRPNLDSFPEKDEWRAYSQLLSHVFSMARRYKAFRAASSDASTPPNFLELLWKVALYLYEARYLYENSSYTDALDLLDLAEEMCEDRTARIYSSLLNIRLCIYLDKNDLISCRNLQDKVEKLQKVAFHAEDPIDRELRARQLHNSGNLACAEGNWNTAIDNYKASNAMKATVLQFSIQEYGRTHLCLGRAYYFKGEWDNAREHYRQATNIFDQDSTHSSAWLAHLKYAMGNLENALGNVEQAKQNYLQSQVLWEEAAPFHIALTGCLYKLAILAGEAGNNDLALEYIGKGLAVARFKKSKGDEARLLRKQAWAYELQANMSKSMESLLLARELRGSLQREGEETVEDSDASWDRLVSIFWR